MNLHDEYTIGEHLLSSLVNGDVSGLEPSDELALERFVGEIMGEVGGYLVWELVDEGSSFALCEVTNMFNMCYWVRLYVSGSAS
jgi:hypothetical protein